MILEGKIQKDGKFLMVDFAAIDAATQGLTKAELLEMAKDLIHNFCVGPAEVSAAFKGKDTIEIEVTPSKAIVPVMLRRQREKSGLTGREVSAILGEKSHGSYAAYERGEREPSLEKLEELLGAVSKQDRLKLRVG